MWRKLVCGIVFGLAGLGHSLGQEHSAPGNLVARCNWGRLEIISGRVTLSDTHLGHKATVSSGDLHKGVHETLSFSARSPDSAWLHYEYADDQQRMLVDVERARQVTIERLPQSDSQLAAVRFRQPERGMLTLAVESEDGSIRIGAVSFWHLMLSNPQACRDHLVPVLQSLRPDWRLEWTAGRIEGALLDIASRGQTPDYQRMEKLVAELGDSKFVRRQAADRQLREMGQTALAYLNGLDERALDVEQRTRIRRIKKALKVNDGDTPARVAAWLAGDVPVWLSLLDRDEQHARVVAARHLASLTGKPIAFDPLADRIDRRRRLARLRAEFGLDEPWLAGRGDDSTLRR